MGQRTVELPLFVLVAGVAAFILTDLLGWIRLNSVVTNLLAGGVFLVLLLWNIVQLRGTAQMVGIANILVYMQIVCLFQEKDDRTCWALALLGLLQVVVAAALNQSVVFGVLLIAYLALAPATLGLLCAFRQLSGRPELPASDTPLSQRDSGGFRAVCRVNEATERQIVRLVRRHVRWVLATTLVVTVALFFLMPRPRSQAFSGLVRMPVRSVGFTDRVRLGELGRVIENPQEVLRIRLTDAVSDERYPVLGPIYLRGAILTDYSRGQWSHPGSWAPATMWPLPALPVSERKGLVRQDIVIEPLDRPELFCVWPILAEYTNPGVLLDVRKMTLVRSTELVQTRFRYQLLTPAFHEGQQWQASPTFTPSEFDPQLRRLPDRDGPNGIPTLYALADEWVREFHLNPDDPYTIARIFERQLRDSGRFSYTLQGQPRDPRIDPIEDFLTRNPRGHCEYFATALVLLLRSVGVPARLVIGYKTEEWNPIGGFFQVRQLHAHAWVEVYLRMDQLPEELRLEGPIWDRAVGVWLRLDPTPPPENSLPFRIYWAMWRVFDWMDFLWRHYVVELDRSRQQEAIYRPISTLVSAIWAELQSSVEEAGNRAAAIARQVAQRVASPFGRAIAVVLGLGFVAVLVVALRHQGREFIRSLLSLLRIAQKERAPQDHIVAFYRQLERLLARWGLQRPASQTPRELARRARSLLADCGVNSELGHIPERIVDAFYQVRFGKTHLSEETDRDMHAQLDLLAKIRPPMWNALNSRRVRAGLGSRLGRRFGLPKTSSENSG